MAGLPKNPIALTGAQRRALRGLGHHLKPTVQIGRNGLTQAVIEATRHALRQHELIKLSVGQDVMDDRKAGLTELADATGSHLAQVIGRTGLLYRRRHDDPIVVLPGTFEECPRPGAARDGEDA